MIKNDESFVCENCGFRVEILGYTSRNHCPRCLFSKHVDVVPGDRENPCGGLLIPIAVEVSPKKGHVIVHKCTKCGEVKRNKAANDDNFDKILEIMRKF